MNGAKFQCWLGLLWCHVPLLSRQYKCSIFSLDSDDVSSSGNLQTKPTVTERVFLSTALVEDSRHEGEHEPYGPLIASWSRWHGDASIAIIDYRKKTWFAGPIWDRYVSFWPSYHIFTPVNLRLLNISFLIIHSSCKIVHCNHYSRERY